MEHMTEVEQTMLSKLMRNIQAPRMLGDDLSDGEAEGSDSAADVVQEGVTGVEGIAAISGAGLVKFDATTFK